MNHAPFTRVLGFPFSRASRVLRAWLVLGLFCAGTLRAAGPDAPRYFGAKPGSLVRSRGLLAAGDPESQRALKHLLAEADVLLKESPPTILEKTATPPSGDKHDYMSLAPYYWPNPKFTNGLPYVRQDGRVNPESRDSRVNDAPRLKHLSAAVETLALAYYFSENEVYAAQAAKFLRAWFLDPATRMNPHFKFAQAVRGENQGRGTGILEARSVADAADAAGLLAGSKAWSAGDQKALDAWLSTFLDWLLTSPPGQEEHAAKNNHGSWYDVQTAKLALCLGRTNEARRIIEEAKQRRIALQIEPDGRQPLELERTASYNYSCFNLGALGELAVLGEHVGVDLWNFRTPDGRGIRAAIGFLLGYVGDTAKPWPYTQIKERSDEALFEVLRKARSEYHDAELNRVRTKYSESSAKRSQLLFVP